MSFAPAPLFTPTTFAIVLVKLPVIALVCLCTAALYCKMVVSRMLHAMLAVMLAQGPVAERTNTFTVPWEAE